MDPEKDLEINRAFQKLAHDIIPDDEHLKNANICIYNIVELLKRKSRFKIGQVCISGSSGKKTTICGSDVDCVLFINEKQPTFEDVLEEFENILNMTESFQIRDVSVSKCSVQFKSNNFEIDMLPAANFFPNCHEDDSDHLDDLQQQKVLDYIKKDPETFGYLYSGSLAKATVQFMKRQDGFAHEMARLSKFWYKTLYFEGDISGAKSLIELVAIYAAIKERNYESVSYLRCFAEIMKSLQNFDNLNIVFESEYKFPQHQVLERSHPRVMDPVNPYNNFAKNWNKKSITLIKQYAKETCRRLQLLGGRNRNIIRLDSLFDPQPTHLATLTDIFPYNAGVSQWLVGIDNYNLSKDLKIRNDKFWKEIRYRKGIEILKNYFQLMMNSVMASPNCNVKEVQDCVQNLISNHIINEPVKWSNATDNHDNFDITFTVPVASAKAVRISYRL